VGTGQSGPGARGCPVNGGHIKVSFPPIESETTSLHQEQNPKGERNNARSAEQTQVKGNHASELLEDANSGGGEPDVYACGLCRRNVTENRAGGADGKSATGAQQSSN
jgi:hypothetical protein